MSRFNLSGWAVKHQPLLLFLIIAISIGGLSAYTQLGRAEDPTFSVKVMVIEAFWPGATAYEMQSQVADRIEKRLQELPYFDYVKTYSRPGISVLQLQLKDDVPGRLVPTIWYQARKKSADSKKDLPEGVIGPVFNDEYGDVFSAVYMISGDWLNLSELKDQATSSSTAPVAAKPKEDNMSLKDVGTRAAEQAEKELVLRVLEETSWNRKQAARRLNICYKALLNKLKRWQIDNRHSFQSSFAKPTGGKDFQPLPF